MYKQPIERSVDWGCYLIAEELPNGKRCYYKHASVNGVFQHVQMKRQENQVFYEVTRESACAPLDAPLTPMQTRFYADLEYDMRQAFHVNGSSHEYEDPSKLPLDSSLTADQRSAILQNKLERIYTQIRHFDRTLHRLLPLDESHVIDWRVLTACGRGEEWWKCSYHVIATNVWMQNVYHAGAVARHADMTVDDEADRKLLDAWVWRKGDKEFQCRPIADPGVYTKHRIFRLPGNRKLGSTRPLIPVQITRRPTPSRDGFRYIETHGPETIQFRTFVDCMLQIRKGECPEMVVSLSVDPFITTDVNGQVPISTTKSGRRAMLDVPRDSSSTTRKVAAVLLPLAVFPGECSSGNGVKRSFHEMDSAIASAATVDMSEEAQWLSPSPTENGINTRELLRHITDEVWKFILRLNAATPAVAEDRSNRPGVVRLDLFAFTYVQPSCLRWCPFLMRQHTHNNSFFCVHLKEGMLFHRCHASACESARKIDLPDKVKALVMRLLTTEVGIDGCSAGSE